MFTLPEQNIPKSKKTKEWHSDHVLQFISKIDNEFYSDEKEQIRKLMNAYSGILTKEQKKIIEKTVTNPNGFNLGVDYMIYPLIKNKIDQIVGIYMDRPIKRKAYSVDKDSISKKLEHQLTLVTEQIFREINSEIEQETGIPIETENPNIDLPDDIEEYMQKTYKTHAEELANDIMIQFLDVEKNNRYIKEALRQILIAERSHIKIYDKNGSPAWRIVHPLNCYTDKDPQKEVQDDHDYFVEIVYMSENEILNSFSLSKENIAKVKAYFANVSVGNSIMDRGASEKNDKNWYAIENHSYKMAVVEMDWKSQKTVNILTYDNKHTGEKVYKKMDDEFVPKNRDEERLKRITGFEHRFCIMLGHDIVLDYGEREYRNSRKSNPTNVVLDSVSLILGNPIGSKSITSIASILYKLQDFASEQLFALRLLSKKNVGRVLVYDTAQIPKEYLKDGQFHNALNRVMHHAKKDGMIFINSKDKQSRFAFNQFTSVDLSTQGMAQDIITSLQLIETLADKWIGLSPEAQGDVQQYATASGNERAVKGTLTRLENIFVPFDNFIQSAIDLVILRSKSIYKEEEIVQFIFGDIKTKFMKVLPDFFMADIGIYFGYPNKDQAKKASIDRAAEILMGNSQTEEMILAAVQVLGEDSASEAEAILKKAIITKQKIMEQQMKAQQEAMQKAEAKQDQKDADNLETERMRINKDIIVSRIYAQNKTEIREMEINHDSLKTLADIENQALADFRQAQIRNIEDSNKVNQ